MPLSIAGLKAAIKAEQEAVYGVPADPTEEDKFAGALAKAIVNYLIANTLVSTTDVVAGTVTSGPGSGGAVAATGSGTGTIS